MDDYDKEDEMKKATIVLHSGDYDKVYSALIIGNGALSIGMECSIYFTFWGLERLRKGKLASGKLSRMHMFGLGKLLMKRKMAAANVASLQRLMKAYKELGGRIIACEMTLEVMGIKKSDLDESLVDVYGAVGTYLNDAMGSDITLFI